MAAGTSTTIEITALHVSGKNNVARFSHCSQVVFKQNVEPEWNSQRAYGKMDAIPFYSGATRTMAVQFKALASKRGGSKQSADAVAAAAAKLMQFQYPVYSNNIGVNVLFSPPFFKLEHSEPNGGSSFAPVEGYITQLQINEGVNEGKKTLGSSGGHLVNSEITISFVFNILSNNLPGWSQTGQFLGDRFFAFEGKEEKPPPDPVPPAATPAPQSDPNASALPKGGPPGSKTPTGAPAVATGTGQ